MSMLSEQCDKLRELATRFDEIRVGATRAVRIPLDTGSVLREAADTIDRLDAENAKLREDLTFERSENGWAREFLNRMAKHCGTKDCPSLVAYVGQLESEADRLRELVDYVTPIAWYAASERERDRMRELGVDE